MATTLYDDRGGEHPADYVPGFGVVYWSEAAKDTAAGTFVSLHKPSAKRWSREWFARRRRCLFCETRWSCPQARWGRRRLRGRKPAVSVVWVGEW